MAKPVPIILLLLIVCANHSFCDHSYQNSINQLDEELKQLDKEITALISRRADVDRQGLGGSFLGGPLALAALVFGLRNLPTLLMAPLAVAGIRPTIGAVGQFMSSIGALNNGNNMNIAQNIAHLLKPPTSTQQSSDSGDLATSGSSNSPSYLSAPGSTSSFASALRSISELIFNRRNSYNFFSRFPIKAQVAQSDQNSEQKPSTSQESAQNRIAPLVSSLRDVYGILRNGLRRYEITDTDCQSRIICELHQKAVGKSEAASVGSLTAHMLDLIGIENQLDRSSAFNDRAKAFIKDFIRAAKTGMSNSDCSSTFSRCRSVPELPQLNAINALNADYFNSKPNIFDLKPLLNSKPPSKRINRMALKSFLTNPRTAAYILNSL